MIDYLFSKNVKEECINFLKEYLSLNEEDQKNYASEKLNCIAKDIDYPIDFTDLTVVRVKNTAFNKEKSKTKTYAICQNCGHKWRV